MTPAHTSLHELVDLGQAVRLDSISRDWLDDGELARMIDELSVVGVTSNPTIFAAALASSTYDDDIARLAAEGLDDRAIFERLAVDDIRRTCDLLAPVHQRSGGVDGMVSIELEPDLADDTRASIDRAHQLWQAVDRPNLMIKVPATEAGLPAIEEILAAGINVNVTLLFAVSVYEQVIDRYLRALERRAEAGLSLDVQSVASFFVSRVDTKVDELPADSPLRGTVAVANAVAAWDAWRAAFGGERFAALAGAAVQRPLWASTGTKNPAYSDILYVQELIVPESVNTMPLATMRAFADHGSARVTVEDPAAAHATLAALGAAGVDLSAVTAQLREEGVAAFQRSFDELLERIRSRRGAVATPGM